MRECTYCVSDVATNQGSDVDEAIPQVELVDGVLVGQVQLGFEEQHQASREAIIRQSLAELCHTILR